ncbi:unnamed protein product [Sphenostylis stenocarpa]|uniref:Uncharacterized protein n=1 Tax=Sphenostylis stenocarpa TaxID=92480 RepID=A0AA86S5L4_9FABA|nr:unnamed protein product [Sphenostylis stenocarpa]
MYADLVENGGQRSVKERLNGNGTSGPTWLQQQRQITGKSPIISLNPSSWLRDDRASELILPMEIVVNTSLKLHGKDGSCLSCWSMCEPMLHQRDVDPGAECNGYQKFSEDLQK